MGFEQGLSLGVQQKQQLTLNAYIKQSLAVLQMPVQELGQYIAQAICDNPMLEMEPAAAEEELFAPVPLEAAELLDHGDDEPPDAAGEILRFSEREIWRTAGAGGAEVERLAGAGQGQTFRESLLEQLGTMRLAEPTLSLSRYLVECLDRRGYLPFEPQVVAEETGAPLYEVMQALYLVQSLHPAGVGARSLSECLMLQLVAGEHFSGHTIRLVKDGLPLLAKNDLKGVAALLGASRAEAAACCEVVRSLSPIPSRGYNTGEAVNTVVPDAAVQNEDGRLAIIVNERHLPKLELSGDYNALLKTTADPETAAWLRKKQSEATGLIHSVEEREKTLLRVLRRVVDAQPDYFSTGQGLKPMTMSSLAEKLGLHLSTISRAVQGKYIVCAAGTVELKSLFSAAVCGHGDNVVSGSLVKERIKTMIDAEDPAHPLTDQSICDALKSMNIDVSRRLIVKYRDAMGIPASSRRRVRG